MSIFRIPYKRKIFAVDVAIILNVAAYVAKNETTKKKGFWDEPDMKFYETKARKCVWYEITKILTEGLDFVYIFDGKSPQLKKDNIGITRKQNVEKNKKRYITNHELYLKRKAVGINIDATLKKDLRNSWIQSTPLPVGIYTFAKSILSCLGIPYLQAPGEAERDCAYLAKMGIVDGVYTSDSDTLVHGAPFIATKAVWNANDYEETTICFKITKKMPILKALDMSHKEFVDLCIAMKCDYNSETAKALGRFGVVSAYKLMIEYRRLHKVPKKKKDLTGLNWKACRKEFADPKHLNNITSSTKGYEE